MTGTRPPDVIGLGCRRCATSWLHECLSGHPQIGKPPGGLHFFSEHYANGTEWYLDQLREHADRPALVEFSVSYSYPEHYQEAARRIHDLVPYAKLFIAIRNPIERAFSDYLRSVRNLETGADIPFEDAIRANPALLERGLYARIISRYLDLFPKERLLVLFYDDLKTDAVSFVGRLLEFIGVDTHAALPETPESGGTVRWPLYNRLVFSAKGTADRVARGLGLEATWERFKSKRRTAYMKVLKANVVETEMAPRTREDLRSYYEKDIARLEQLTGRDLTHWK